MAGRYRENRGWERATLRSPEGRSALRGIANEYKAAVIGNVPVKTGFLQDQYIATARVRSGKLSAGLPTMRLSVAPRNEDNIPLWSIIEYGSVKNMPYAPLRRGADEVGLQFDGKASRAAVSR